MKELLNKYMGKCRKLLNSGFLFVFGSSVINKVIGFLSTVILVRILTKAEYGIFTYSWNIYCIAVLFSGLGMASGVLQLLSERNQDTEYCNAIYGYAKKVGTLFNILLFLAFIGIAMFAPLKINGAKRMLIFLSLLPEFQFQYDIQTAYIRSKKNNKAYGILVTLNSSLILVASVIGACVAREMGLVAGRYIAFFVTYLVALQMGVIPKHVWVSSELDKNEIHSLVSISGISMLNSGLSQALYLIDVFVIGIVVAEETVIATYKVATQIPTALSFIPAAVVIYIYPYFAEKRDDKKWCLRAYKKILLCMGTFNSLVAAILILGAKPIVSIIFGKNYLDAVIPFRILSLSYFFSGTFRTIAGNLLVTQRKLSYNTFVAVSSGCINLIMDYLLIKYYGINGAAIATLLIVVLTSIMNVLYLLFVFRQNRR